MKAGAVVLDPLTVTLELFLQWLTYLETICSLSDQSHCNALFVPLHMYLLFNSLSKFSSQKSYFLFEKLMQIVKYLCMFVHKLISIL